MAKLRKPEFPWALSPPKFLWLFTPGQLTLYKTFEHILQ